MQSISEIVSLYNDQALDYFDRTAKVDRSETLTAFAKLLPMGASVVDAGCGSGRDSVWFLANGFQVYSYDASSRLCSMAEGFIGGRHKVHCHLHTELALPNEADAIWAQATLLFLSDEDLQDSLRVLHKNLTPGGLLFTSFKKGTGWRDAGDRKFRDLTLADVGLLTNESGFRVHSMWEEVDSLGRGHDWCSFVLQK